MKKKTRRKNPARRNRIQKQQIQKYPTQKNQVQKKQPNAKGIAYQNKDVASKITGEALLGSSLAPFGLPHIRIVDALPTNLPAIESNELRLDNLFLLDDGAIAMIDYI